ncbi:hypothetical protein BBK36DRAFT_1172571 [Trichoderma citrinoviride]|uniref:Uncharacterized protein n=1 Tax=Trichoderma citrinoviride TaxID=58853 RepID=A0A2T4AZ77_9HYPO|nr:hypothetical protein BBK36DRAFT_1172571 [Trichoderma citrinoviride]PTB62374.1 hypothetical protein BBK36DRAFT_1172571 [Trichoderma citrinoviride]
MASSRRTSVISHQSWIDPLSSPPPASRGRQPVRSSRSPREQSPTIVRVQRKDSGYESHASSPRTSATYIRPKPSRRVSGMSKYGTASAQSLRSRIRPQIRRPATTQTSVSYQPRTIDTALPTAYYQFQAPELAEVTETSQEAQNTFLPPQTTHYWTSDRTRRLEYAAIDAAGKGVKGWIRKNLLPDCFAGKNRHVAFDDDTGSVRRYRLDLEDEPEEKCVSACNTSSSRKSRFSIRIHRKSIAV